LLVVLGINSLMNTDIIDADDVPADFECAVCQEVLNNPVQLPCSHLFCSGCLAECLRMKSMCPICRAELPPGFSAPKATEIIKRMEGIKVRCSNKGCKAVVTLAKLHAHQDSCSFAASADSEPVHVFQAPEGHKPPPPSKNRSTFICPYCQMANLPLKDLLEHVNTKHKHVPPSKRRVVCPVCASMPWGDPTRVSGDFTRHLNERHKFDYAEYCDFDGSEEALLEQALRESRQEAEAARRKATPPAPAPEPTRSHFGFFGRRHAAPPAPVPDNYDEDEELRRVLELSRHDF